MKCPYRMVSYSVFENVVNGRYFETEKKEEYADCYEENCPLYNRGDFGYMCYRLKNEIEGKSWK